ncbi:MAG: PIN domain-containing protein [Verrucomicrobiaceae bacterium]|nr:MAG: PIN domain-containing protein [Verrucomicrobiaceae bacterium]
MKDLVLVDSSAWVEAGRVGGSPDIIARVEGLISSGLAAMTEPVWMELYQGIRGKREEARLEVTRSLCVWLECDAACWQEAARTARICLRSGANVPFGDVLVHACARRHGVELLEKDRHFAMIAAALRK